MEIEIGLPAQLKDVGNQPVLLIVAEKSTHENKTDKKALAEINGCGTWAILIVLGLVMFSAAVFPVFGERQ